jgi:large subunit ribosomal protein L13
MKSYNLDARGKKMGRLASEVASILMGKNLQTFARNVVPQVKVSVSNASKLEMTDKKKSEKMYESYSGYPGGRKVKNLKTVVAEKGYGKVFTKAVYGMLPKNRLRSRMIKNLVVTE